jgi:hypothetical protein
VWVLPALGCFLFFSAITALAAAGYAMHLAMKAVIDVKALQNSTHNIQFVPAEPEDEGSEKALNQAIARGDMETFQRLHDISDFQEPLM